MTDHFYQQIASLTQTAPLAHTAPLAYTAPLTPAAPTLVEHEANDLTAWVMDQLQPSLGENVLNVGSSNRRQVLALAKIVGEHGFILALDRSYRVLHALSQRSLEQGMEQRIRFLYLNLDELDGHLRANSFERALGTRALSHVKQPQAVFRAIHHVLRQRGVFFFYGPARKDLAELRLFTAALQNESFPPENRELVFVEKIGLPCAREIFSEVQIMKFEHPLYLASADDLFACWYESAFYEEELESAFRRAAARHFDEHSTFVTAQRLVGIRAMKL